MRADIWDIHYQDWSVSWPVVVIAVAVIAVAIWILSKIGRVLFKLALVALVVVVVWSIASGTDLREVFSADKLLP